MAGRGCLQRTTPAQTRLIEQVLCSDAYSLTYVGAVGRGLLRVTDLFNPNKDFRFVWLTTNSATWDYHALQVKFERRLAQGLQALGSYTWSHSMDIASTKRAYDWKFLAFPQCTITRTWNQEHAKFQSEAIGTESNALLLLKSHLRRVAKNLQRSCERRRTLWPHTS